MGEREEGKGGRVEGWERGKKGGKERRCIFQYPETQTRANREGLLQVGVHMQNKTKKQ